jgi:hypothetical protein
MVAGVQAREASRIRIAAAAAVVAATAAGLIAVVPAATGGPAVLTPDLLTLAIGEAELAVERRGKRTLLRFTNEIANRANGPLEIFPAAGSANCDGDGDPLNDRDASQRLFADSDGSGAYEAESDLVEDERRIGCMRYHPAHDHWHLLEVALYELRDERTGALAARSRKVGFCLTDTRLAFPGAGSPAEPRYPLGSADPSGCDPDSTQGISAGWADSYRLTLAGQDLDVSDLDSGRYCLSSTADPGGLIEELVEANNRRRVRIALRPRKLRVRKLGGACRA